MNKKTYITVGSIIVSLGLIVFALYYSKCQGGECDNYKKIDNPNYKVENKKEVELFPKMIPSMINEQVKNNEIILIDVREVLEWDEGHIFGAQHIALSDLDVDTTKSLSHDKPIYVYCRSGKRAEEAEMRLKLLGFDNAENLGGIIYWQGRGGELIK